MNIFNIKFTNRARADDGPSPEKTQAEFMLFAALCEARGMASFVKGVDFSRHTGMYEILLSDAWAGDDGVAAGIEWCAEETLFQYEVDGRGVGHKKDPSEAIEIDRLAIVLTFLTGALATCLSHSRCGNAKELAAELDAQAKAEGASQRVMDLDLLLTELMVLGSAGTEQAV